VDDEEPAGCPLVDIAGEDRNRRDLRGLDRVAFVDPLADEDRKRLVTAVANGRRQVGVLNSSGDVDDASGPYMFAAGTSWSGPLDHDRRSPPADQFEEPTTSSAARPEPARSRSSSAGSSADG